jgi:hypothetical protein
MKIPSKSKASEILVQHFISRSHVMASNVRPKFGIALVSPKFPKQGDNTAQKKLPKHREQELKNQADLNKRETIGNTCPRRSNSDSDKNISSPHFAAPTAWEVRV